MQWFKVILWMRRYTKISFGTLNRVVSWFLHKEWAYLPITNVFKKTDKLSLLLNYKSMVKQNYYQQLQLVTVLTFFHWSERCWTPDASRTSSYEITLVRPPVCPYVRPPLIFLKIGSLVLSDIVHNDIWQ